MSLKKVLSAVALFGLLVVPGALNAESLSPEASLREAYLQARDKGGFDNYPFTIRSSEQGRRLSADVLMLLNIDFSRFRKQLQTARNWCEFLLLTLNIKSCVNRQIEGRQYLVLYAGRKEYQPPEITYQLKYHFRVEHNRERFFEARLFAEKGPMLTHNYDIRVSATPGSEGTLLRLGMSYDTSVFSRAATFTYLQTLGRNKIGFTIVSHDEHGEPIYIDGVKAIIERNVMRYFLALSVYLKATRQAGRVAFRTMLGQWFDATERYHAQLYEYGRDTYIKAKLHESLNQRELQQKADTKTRADDSLH
jgi:hypothetical protein